jgi:2-C-methyl-D-erythritol 2,4-cyclodiphosphate synthase
VTPRVGIGYDVHRLVAGRALVLGGVHIESDRGLLGHSDADVVCHAIADALLGALGLGDLGEHFPPDDPRWKDASSLDLLRRVRALLDQRQARIANVDVAIVAEAPRVAPHRAAMVSALAHALGVDGRHVSVKATTNEGLGAVGRGEGIAAWAVALVEAP